MNKRPEELADLENANVEFTPFHQILIKQEPLHQDFTETCPNAQDSLFNVVKQEGCGDRSEMEHLKDNIDVAAGTHLSVTQIKQEPVQTEASSPADALNMDSNQRAPGVGTVLTANEDVSMLKHLLTEYNIECHRCHICNYQCAYRSVLKRHMRIHTQDKPYSCKHCHFKCSRASYLKQHMKIHTREKLYVASIATKLCEVVTNTNYKTKK